jgi:hypothetical protein
MAQFSKHFTLTNIDVTADVEGIRNKAIVTTLSYYAGIFPEGLGKTAKI